MPNAPELVERGPRLIGGFLLGIGMGSVIGMLAGSFAGGGANPQAFAVMVAILGVFGLGAWVKQGAQSIGGRRAFVGGVMGSILAFGLVVASGLFLGFASSLIPVYFLVCGLGGAAGVWAQHRFYG